MIDVFSIFSISSIFSILLTDKSVFVDGFDGGGSIDSVTAPSGHVNFFQNLEEGEKLAKVIGHGPFDRDKG